MRLKKPIVALSAAGLLALAALAIVVAALALVPTTADLPTPSGSTTLQCGADTYFFGYPDHAVDEVCRAAYRTRAHTLERATLVALVGLGALAWPLNADDERRRRLRLQAAAAIAVPMLLLGVAALLRPVPVAVDGGSGPTIADCGIDSFVAGHPDAAVEKACGAEAGRYALAGGGLVLATTLATVAWVQHRRREGQEHDSATDEVALT